MTRPDLPKEGFIRTTRPQAPAISGQHKSQLIRKANELFNAGRLDEAGRIYLTLGYSDGLIRLGEKLLAAGRPFEAYRMFWLAPDRKRVEQLSKRMAILIRKMMKED